MKSAKNITRNPFSVTKTDNEQVLDATIADTIVNSCPSDTVKDILEKVDETTVNTVKRLRTNYFAVSDTVWSAIQAKHSQLDNTHRKFVFVSQDPNVWYIEKKSKSGKKKKVQLDSSSVQAFLNTL